MQYSNHETANKSLTDVDRETNKRVAVVFNAAALIYQFELIGYRIIDKQIFPLLQILHFYRLTHRLDLKMLFGILEIPITVSMDASSFFDKMLDSNVSQQRGAILYRVDLLVIHRVYSH